MLGDEVLAARLRTYELMERAQGDDHASALIGLQQLEAEHEHLPEVALLARVGQVLYAVVHDEDRQRVEHALDALVARAEQQGSPGLTALALSLRAVSAGTRHDSEVLLTDAGRAVSMAEEGTLCPMDRCAVLVICAAAYNSLSLWELVQELYDQASALAPDCERAVQEPALAVNRVLVRLEWATALFELEEVDAALVQLRHAAEAVEAALRTADLPPLWQLDARACRDLLALVACAHDPSPSAGEAEVDARLATLRAHRDALAAAGDVEVLPLLDALVVLSLHRLGRRTDAVAASRDLAQPESSSTGARSFPGWVRAHVLTGDESDEAVHAHRSYGLLMARSRWTARRAVLAAARSKIEHERLGVDHARLSRDVLLDPLTGLSNRREFDAWMARRPTVDSVAAMILVDVDSFKEVNDVHGHAVGDKVLRHVARLVTGHVRSGDMALRLGGDEFAVVMTEDLDPDSTVVPAAASKPLHDLADARARALSDAVTLADWDRLSPGLRVTISVGVAAGVVGPDEPRAAELLYHRADAALYRAKSAAPLVAARP